jgi:hypothetical protein
MESAAAAPNDRSRVYRQVWKTSGHTLPVADIPESALNRNQLSHGAPSHVKNVPNTYPSTYLTSHTKLQNGSPALPLLREGTAPNWWKDTSLYCSFSNPQASLTPDNLLYYASYAASNPRYTHDACRPVAYFLVLWSYESMPTMFQDAATVILANGFISIVVFC